MSAHESAKHPEPHPPTAAESYAHAKETAGELEKRLEAYIREKPLKSILLAAGAGVLLGLLLRR